MNVFESIDELWYFTCRELLKAPTLGSRNGLMRELLGFQVKLMHINNTVLLNPIRRWSPHYAAGELIWYLSGEQAIDRIVAYAPQYVKFANDGIAHGAYGRRFEGALLEIKEVINRQANTRQAVIGIWQSSDLNYVEGAVNDIPCTLAWQFIYRAGKLHMVCNMRSNDAWLGLPYDIFVNTMIQRILALSIGCECGTYTHNVGSMHVYEKNVPKIQSALRWGIPFCEHGWKDGMLLPEILTTWKAMAVDVESLVREARAPIEQWEPELRDMPAPLRDIVYCCASKWVDVPITRIRSHALKEVVRAHC